MVDEAQGTDVADNQAHEDVQNVETDTVDTQDDVQSDKESSEPAEAVEEDTEVDYQERYENQKKSLEYLERKAERQRVALANMNKRIKEIAESEGQAQPQAAQRQELVKPDIDSFDTFAEYEAANEKYYNDLAEQKAQNVLAEKQQKEHAEKLEAELKVKQAEFAKKEAEFKLNNPEYDKSKKEVARFLEDMQPVDPSDTQAQSEYNLRSNAIYRAAEMVGAVEMINYFGQNGGENIGDLQELFKINDPMQLGVKMYELSLQAKTGKSLSKKADKKTPPPKPVGKSKSTGSKSDALHDGLSMDEWMKRRNKRQA